MDKYKALTSQGKEAYMNALTAIGWFDFAKTSKEEIAKRLNEETNINELCCCLWELWFDAEGFEDDEPYNSLLSEILGIIGMKNIELNVVYEKSNNSVRIELKTQSNNYHYSIPMESDWVDEELIDEWLNNEVLAGEKIESRFFALPPTDQTVQFIFVPPMIYDKAIKTGIIPDFEGYFIAD
jgi:hypothetical protein